MCILLTYCYHVAYRAYLKSVAKKLAEDVDNLKNTAGTMGRVSYIINNYNACNTLQHSSCACTCTLNA